MNRLIVIFLIFIISSTAHGKTAKVPLVLLSIDGFAYDYLASYQPPNIIDFAKSGASAKLLPIYPSKTFPNHLSIMTGVYPKKHGIIHNKFYHPGLDQEYSLGSGRKNSAWLTAKPFWALVEENNIKSAVYFWPESEAIGQGSQPTYNIPYNTKATNIERFDQIIDWLKLPEVQAPKFIVSYFSSVDSAGHKFGLGSPELAQAVTNIDRLFGSFIKRLQQEIPQKVNVILLSDHGMVQMDMNKTIDLKNVFSEEILKFTFDKSVVISQSSTQLYVYFNQKSLDKNKQKFILEQINSRQKVSKNLYSVYHKNNYPKHWQFDDNLIITPDIVIEAAPSASFVNQKYFNSNVATHGYDAKNQNELAAIFFASGPNIRKGRAIAPFENIHIVPLMSNLLNIKQPNNIDGKKVVLESIIKSN